MDLKIQTFGQRVEPLTDRLRVLLEDYPDGLAIPKELIQNADDAGATEVRFLYDERENADAMAGLLDDRMRAWQGPALWVYNDAEFSKEDIAAIKRIGGATKEEKKDKIGKFGLGFNAVYNITDVPSFITGNSLAFFDPHNIYLPGKYATRDDPGLIIDISSRHTQIQLAGQLKPYRNVFDCATDSCGVLHPYHGKTLFRLPLRKQGTVSNIKNVPYTNDDVLALLQQLAQSAKHLLLFTHNVKTVSIFRLPHLEMDPSNAQRVFQVETKAVQTVLGASNLASLENQHLPSNGQHSAVIWKTDVTYSSSPVNCVPWLVYQCLGTEESLKLAKSSKCYSPVAGVAVELEQVGSEYKPVPINAAPVFCFLPLPSSVRSGLPIIVNGMFAIKRDRRHLVEATTDEMGDAMGRWNAALQKDAITKAYIGCLEQMTKPPFICDGDPYALWPDEIANKMDLHTFYQEFYSSSSAKIFTNGKTWVDIHNAVALHVDLCIAESSVKLIALQTLQSYLDRCGGNCIAVDLPSRLRNALSSIKTYQLDEFYKKAVFPYLARHTRNDIIELLWFALNRIAYNLEKGEQLQRLIKSNACIPVQCQLRLVQPNQLVSPLGRCASLFDEGDSQSKVFPDGTFCNRQHLGVLADCGMTVDKLSWEQIVGRACSITKLGKEAALERTKKLLDYIAWILNAFPSPNSTPNLDSIRMVEFLPALERPDDYPRKLVWKEDSFRGRLVSASNLYMPKYKDLVGSSKLMFDFDKCCISDYYNINRDIMQILGIDKKMPDVDDVIHQLRQVCGSWQSFKSRSQLETVCHVIYQYLDQHCREHDWNDVTHIHQALGNERCVLIGEVFMSPVHCARDFPKKELSPILAQVPHEFQKFIHLMDALGIRAKFDGQDYIAALDRIVPRDHSVQLVRDILECLHEYLIESNDSSFLEDKPVRLPSTPMLERHQGWELVPVDRLCLMSYMSNEDTIIREHGLQYVHPLIPSELAQSFGVKPEGEKLMELFGEGGEEAFGEPFGQNEKLTTRIQCILEGYPCEGILNELLQNADDARATQLSFILDTRQHGEGVQEKYKELLGPALCVYNDATFTKADLDGICNLGKGSKSKDSTKSGQYGIGFNCVYHLTDVPSFLTEVDKKRKVLCFFDPHCSHIIGANFKHPGRRFIGGLLQKLIRLYPDMFNVHIYPGYIPEGSTMFRLPLRTENQENESEKRMRVTIQQVTKLLKRFEEDVCLSLLFTNSVRTITIETTGNPFTAQALLHSNSDKANLATFTEYVKSSAKKLKSGMQILEQVEYKEVIYELEIRDSTGRWEMWLISQCIGFKEPVELGSIDRATTTGELAFLPRGGVALLLDSSDEPDSKQRRSRAFRFLPLPQPGDTGIPVHFNGHFAVDSNRRSFWYDGTHQESKDSKTAWNTIIMEGVVAQAYVSLIRKLCSQLQKQAVVTTSELQQFYRSFPAESSNHFISVLGKSFYTILRRNQTKCLAVQMQNGNTVETKWFSIEDSVKGHAFFEPRSWLSQKYLQSQKTSESLLATLSRIGFNLLSCPIKIYTSLKSAEIEVVRVKPRTVFEYLRTYRQQNCAIKELPLALAESPLRDVESVETLLKYCYNDFTAQKEAGGQSDKLPAGSQQQSMKKKKKKKEDKRPLEGLPLCVTHNLTLKEFSSRQACFRPKDLLLAPNNGDAFVCENVFKMCSKFWYVDPAAPRELGIKDLAGLIPAYPELVDTNEGKIKVPWHPDNGNDSYSVTLKEWIRMIWLFIDVKLNERSHLRHEVPDEKILQPLHKYCIIPVVENGKHFLYRLKNRKDVIESNAKSSNSGHFLGLLHAAGIPVLKPIDGTLLPHQWLMASVNEAGGILHALLSLHQANPRQLRDMTSRANNANVILKYFANAMQVLKDGETIAIRKLPIHTLVDGTVTHIDHHLHIEPFQVIIVPKAVPPQGLGKWTSLKFIFMSDSDVDALYERMDCRKTTNADLYRNFILDEDNFHNCLDEEAQLLHLDYLSHRVLPDLAWKHPGIYTDLISCLEHLPFLRDSNGRHRLAKDTFHPDVPLFRIMEKDFPPEHFHSEAGLQFLAKCGLQTTITEEHLLRYCRLIESRGHVFGSVGRAENKPAAQLIYEALVNDYHEQDEQDFHAELRNIQFIPIEKVPQPFVDLCPQQLLDDLDAQPLVSFQDSVLYPDHDVCWTAAKILPKWLKTADTAASLLEVLGVQYPVSMSTCLKHCSKLAKRISSGNSLSTDPETIKHVKCAMDKIYAFLITNTDEHCPNQLKELTDVPCIWVDDGKCLVLPSRVVVDLQENDQIKPYLYRLPSELHQYHGVLRHVGVRKEPEMQHYSMVLQAIKDIRLDEVLDDRQIRDAEKASVALLRLLGNQEATVTDEVQRSCYLLSRLNKLEKSSALIQVDRRLQMDWNIDDVTWPRPLLKVPDKLDELELNNLLQRLPQNLRPQKLSALVGEFLDEACLPDSLNPDDGTHWFLERLQSGEFICGLERVLFHGSRDSRATEGFDEHWLRLKRSLEGIELYTLDSIATDLRYRDGQQTPTELMRRESRPQMMHLEMTDNENTFKVYVSKNDSFGVASERALIQYADKLYMIIATKFSFIDPEIKVVLERLLRAQQEEISTLLNDLYITSRREIGFQARIGEEIPIEKHWVLVPDLETFTEGDIIGWELEEPLMNKGIEPGQPRYLYAQVIRDNDCIGILRNYEIAVDEMETTTVHSSMMYKLSVTDNQIYDLEVIESQISNILDMPSADLDTPEGRLIWKRVLKRLMMKWQPVHHTAHEDFAHMVMSFIKRKALQIQQNSQGLLQTSSDVHIDNILADASQRTKNQIPYAEDERPRLLIPDPTEAKMRWLRQAEADLQAVRCDIEGGATEWALQKCHQAAEKALKAAFFMKDREREWTHHLLPIAKDCGDEVLVSLAREIGGTLYNGLKLRYPDKVVPPKIPHDLYDVETCEEMLELTRQLLVRVKCIIYPH